MEEQTSENQNQQESNLVFGSLGEWAENVNDNIEAMLDFDIDMNMNLF